MDIQTVIGHGIRACALGLALSVVSASAAAEAATGAGTEPGRAAGIESRATKEVSVATLESALHDDASVETLLALLADADEAVLRAWMVEHTRHSTGCDADHWLVALQAALAASDDEQTVALLADILRTAPPEMYPCTLRSAHAELDFAGRDGFPLLAEAVRSAGILDPLYATVDDALIRQVLDAVLAPGAPGYDTQLPFINPLEPERAASRS